MKLTVWKGFRIWSGRTIGLFVAAALCALEAVAQPTLVDRNLSARTVVSGLDTPTSMAFLGANDFLVLEKATGKVKRVTDGAVSATVLDLAVNSNSERGLLGIALDPQFSTDPAVYLYWTESSTGADTDVASETPLLGNRVDRFLWDGATLTHDADVIRIRAIQNDASNGRERGNHDGGVLEFGPDGKLYVYIGDLGRRGQMQNLPDGPGAAGAADDQFGGPEPDNAHLSGVILRLNEDGSAPIDNPFFVAGEMRGGEAGANLQKVFAYGIRNGFGMAFDPKSGNLWEAQNGDDTFTELNLVEPGANLGWVQVMGPLLRLAQFKEIETSPEFFGLQQVRWSPTNIANSVDEALARMFWVFEGGDEFRAIMAGAGENPPVETEASGVADFRLNADGTLSYETRATGPIMGAVQAHIHLGARNVNGPVVAFLFGPFPEGRDFKAGDVISSGTITDANVIARPGFTPTVANLVERLRQGRAYANLHTHAHPPGEIRGQIIVSDRAPVSHYSDPEFAWKYEIAPAAVGFIRGRALGPQYDGDMIIGAARPTIDGGHLFRMQLAGHRRTIAVDDERLLDGVADNVAKFEITESESLLFGTGFGVGSDVQTGPNGNLYIVSLTNGEVYEIFRTKPKKSTAGATPRPQMRRR